MHTAEGLRIVLESKTGVVGMVDNLLRACPEQGLRLDWQAGACRIRPLAGDSEEAIDVHLHKSVFRAILARIAGLCNEHAPNSVSPYGGKGELSVSKSLPSVFCVSFVNTLRNRP